MHQGKTVACVGAGYWGKNLVRNFYDLGALAAICDGNEETLQTLAQQYPGVRTVTDYAAILSDPMCHAVAIATPAEQHARMVKQALQAGKDVLVEKPLCLSVQEGEEIIALARHRQRVLMVGHLLWYHPAVLRLQELINAGELGRIEYIYSNRLNLGKIRREENILWSFAPHDLSVILGLVGELPSSVQAQGGNYLHEQIADVTTSLLAFPSGVKAHVFVSWLHPFKEQKLVVVGNRKMAVFDDVEKQDKLVLYPHSIEWKNQVPIANKAEAQVVDLELYEPLRAECSHFLECMQTRATPRTDGQEGLRVLTVLQQCQEALTLNLPKPSGKDLVPPTRPFMVHDTACIDDGVHIGEGTTIWHFSHVLKGSHIGSQCRVGQNVVIGPHAVIGNGVKIQNNVSVYEGVTLEDDVFCGPSMVFTNVFNPRSAIPRMSELRPTLVKRGATLGANCTIICGATIGRYALVGAGAVVTKNIPDYALVMGNPARMVGWVCACGEKLLLESAEVTCQACQQCYRKTEEGLQAL